MKYIIEIEDEPFVKDGKKLYKCKSFNSLVFDTIGLGVLEPYKEEEINIGDEVKSLDDDNEIYVVTYIKKPDIPQAQHYYRGIDSNGEWHSCVRHKITKTGRHFDSVETAMKEITDVH